jgi:alginate O-acetyltransferase complex protein AlgI
MPSPTMAASALATMLALVVAAAWHGPALTFIAWGFSHGVALVVNQVWNRQPKKMPDWMGWLVTAIFITSTIVFLRATSMTEALRMLTRLVPHAGALQVAALRNLMPISPSIVLHPFVYGAIAAYFFKSSMEYSKEFHPSFKTALATATLILMSLVFMNSAQARVFVYFGF